MPVVPAVVPAAPRVPAYSAPYSSGESLPSLLVSSSLKRVLSSAASFASSREMKPSWFLSRRSKRLSAVAPVPGCFIVPSAPLPPDCAITMLSPPADAAATTGSAKAPATATAIKGLTITNLQRMKGRSPGIARARLAASRMPCSTFRYTPSGTIAAFATFGGGECDEDRSLRGSCRIGGYLQPGVGAAWRDQLEHDAARPRRPAGTQRLPAGDPREPRPLDRLCRPPRRLGAESSHRHGREQRHFDRRCHRSAQAALPRAHSRREGPGGKRRRADGARVQRLGAAQGRQEQGLHAAQLPQPGARDGGCHHA